MGAQGVSLDPTWGSAAPAPPARLQILVEQRAEATVPGHRGHHVHRAIPPWAHPQDRAPAYLGQIGDLREARRGQGAQGADGDEGGAIGEELVRSSGGVGGEHGLRGCKGRGFCDALHVAGPGSLDSEDAQAGYPLMLPRNHEFGRLSAECSIRS